jgi:hypothetical protein
MWQVQNGVYGPPVINITSVGTPAINGTYAIDTGSQAIITSVAVYIAVNAKFPAGVSTLPYPDVTGTPHVFPTTASFMAFATAVADYVTGLTIGQSLSSTVSIA